MGKCSETCTDGDGMPERRRKQRRESVKGAEKRDRKKEPSDTTARDFDG